MAYLTRKAAGTVEPIRERGYRAAGRRAGEAGLRMRSPQAPDAGHVGARVGGFSAWVQLLPWLGLSLLP